MEDLTEHEIKDFLSRTASEQSVSFLERLQSDPRLSENNSKFSWNSTFKLAAELLAQGVIEKEETLKVLLELSSSV
jgi:hypothetical protein